MIENIRNRLLNKRYLIFWWYFLSECDYYKIHEKFNKIISILGSKRNELNYPQITVVGDQSSGKSSLLETIFDIKLPTASGTCTKCPIVIKSKKNTNLKEINYKLESDRGIEEIDEQNICGKIEDLQNKYTEDGNDETANNQWITKNQKTIW